MCPSTNGVTNLTPYRCKALNVSGLGGECLSTSGHLESWGGGVVMARKRVAKERLRQIVLVTTPAAIYN